MFNKADLVDAVPIVLPTGNILKDWASINQLKNCGIKYERYVDKSHMENLYPLLCEGSYMNICKFVQSNSVLIFPIMKDIPREEFLNKIKEWYLNCENEGRPIWYHSIKETVLFFSSIYGDASKKFFSNFKFLGFRKMDCSYIDIAWSSSSIYKQVRIEVH